MDWMTLAQVNATRSSTDPQALGPVLAVIGMVIGIVVVAGVVILLIRKRLFAEGLDEVVSGSIFEDLRRMRDEGDISIEEYDYLRQCVAAKVAGHEPPPRPAGLVEEGVELRAKPGYDLTGASIPPEVLEAQRRHQAGED